MNTHIQSCYRMCLSFCRQNRTQMAEGLSSVSIDRFSAECTSARHKTGNYDGIAVFIKFLECESLTLSKDDILELKLVRQFCVKCTCCRSLFYMSGQWPGVVVSALASINEVSLRRARLVLRWATVFGFGHLFRHVTN